MSDAPEVTIELPSLLVSVTKCAPRETVRAATLAGALEALFARHPSLRVHVVDEEGAFREHVLCFHNDANTRWGKTLDVPLREGDRVTILQAVSGG